LCRVAKSLLNSDTVQKAWHNYGNAKLMQKSYEDAIYGYKKALKLNPKDEDTRYNLAYAQRELKNSKINKRKTIKIKKTTIKIKRTRRRIKKKKTKRILKTLTIKINKLLNLK